MSKLLQNPHLWVKEINNVSKLSNKYIYRVIYSLIMNVLKIKCQCIFSFGQSLETHSKKHACGIDKCGVFVCVCVRVRTGKRGTLLWTSASPSFPPSSRRAQLSG